jgi:isoquinoline 1-oxidoreductase beta subunit
MTKLEKIASQGAVDATRRGLLIGATLAGGSLMVGCSMGDVLSFGGHKPELGPFGAFIRIDPDGSVTVMNKHQEMGQGTHAGLAAIVAEELDADWSKLKVKHAPANAKLYANLLFGAQATGGSSGVNNSWDQLRKAGAAARAMFVEAAADEWKVPAGEITVKDGVVSHKSGKTAGFGDLLVAASKVTPPQSPVLKDPKTFTLIGTDRVRRKDSLDKSIGAARYTQDVYLPGMLTALVAHSPRFGGKVKSFDATDAKKVKGVVDVFQIPTGVAVIAEGVWAAKKGRDALKVEWDDAKAETRSSDQMLADYKKIAAGGTAPGMEGEKWVAFTAKGDASAAAKPTVEAAYDFPFLAHATMEPMNCVAQVDGNRVKLTFACQGHSFDQLNVGLAVGALPGSVEIETLYAGGSFGRRSTLDSDYVVEAVQVAKHVGKGRPVKLVWTREDDMTGGKYRPLAHHAIAVALDKDGFPAAWKHRIVVQSYTKGTPFEGMMVKKGVDSSSVEGALGSPYLEAAPNVDAQVFNPKTAVSGSWWRSVGATHTALAMEHTIDQLARAANKDPAAYRRALYQKAKADRHIGVLDLVVEKSGWGGKPLKDGWVRGVAVHESFGSVVANVAEVKLVGGEPKVRKVWCAIDCGVAVAPDQIRAQMEGGVCYSLSALLFGAVTLKDGLVQQTNFDTHRVLRHNEAPEVEVFIVPSGNHPTGVGEPGTPVVMAAVANAMLALTGQPVSSLPLVKA